MIALSVSRLNDLECPALFHAKYIDKSYKEPESEPLLVGQLVATLLESYRKHCVRMALSNDLSFWDLPGVQTIASKFSEEVQKRALEIIDNFKRSEFITLPILARQIKIEGQFAYDRNLTMVTDYFGDNVAFRAKMDFACFIEETGEVLVIDDKSGWGDPDPFQLKVYAACAYPLFSNWFNGKIKTIRTVFNDLAKRSSTEHLFTPEDIPAFKDWIINQIKAVNERTEWPAQACNKCQYCQLPGCEIRAQALQTVVDVGDACNGGKWELLLEREGSVISMKSELANITEATAAIELLMAVETIQKKLKDVLKGYVETNGPVQACGKIAELRGRERWSAKDTRAVLNAAWAYAKTAAMVNDMSEDQAAEWATKQVNAHLLSITRSDLEKFCKKAGIEQRLPILKSMGKTTEFKAFDLFKAEPESLI